MLISNKQLGLQIWIFDGTEVIPKSNSAKIHPGAGILKLILPKADFSKELRFRYNYEEVIGKKHFDSGLEIIAPKI